MIHKYRQLINTLYFNLIAAPLIKGVAFAFSKCEKSIKFHYKIWHMVLVCVLCGIESCASFQP